MGFLKNYCRIHIKYASIYIGTIPLMILSYRLGILIILALVFNGVSETLGIIIVNILFSLVSTLPLIPINYKVGMYYKSYVSNAHQKSIMILSHGISLIIYFILYWILGYLQVFIDSYIYKWYK